MGVGADRTDLLSDRSRYDRRQYARLYGGQHRPQTAHSIQLVDRVARCCRSPRCTASHAVCHRLRGASINIIVPSRLPISGDMRTITFYHFYNFIIIIIIIIKITVITCDR